MIAFPGSLPECVPVRPAWVDDALFAETREVWEHLYGRTLTDGEVSEILWSVGRLIDAIQEQKP